MDAFAWANKIQFIDEKIRPDKHTRRIEWNKRWEEDLARTFDEKIFIHRGLRRTQHSRKFQQVAKESTEMMLLAVEGRKEELIVFQGNVASRGLKKLLNENLEERWKSTTADRRKEIVLEAIYKTACVPAGWEKERKWCPDVTISNLCANEGKVFIDWLKLIISSRRSRQGLGPKPVLFPHFLVDKILEEMDLEVSRRETLLMRSHYISIVLWYILLVIYNDLDFVYVGVSRSVKQVGDFKFSYKAAEKLYDKDAARSFKKKRNEYMAEYQPVDTCFYCKQIPEHLMGVSLKVCEKCKEIGRLIRYCSRECQIMDWKKGTVRPHKQICGKLFQLSHDDSFDPTPPEPEALPVKVPEAALTFKRSFALESQVDLVNSSDADYTLVATKPNEDHIDFYFASLDSEDSENNPENSTQMEFLIMRRRAFTNGDSDAVNAMFKLFLPLLEEDGIPAERLATQLEKEFGVKVDDEFELSSVTTWTEEEKDWALGLIAIFDLLEELQAEYCSF